MSHSDLEVNGNDQKTSKLKTLNKSEYYTTLQNNVATLFFFPKSTHIASYYYKYESVLCLLLTPTIMPELILITFWL